MKKVNITSISNKINFIYGDECEKNTVGIVIFSDGMGYFFDAECKKKMSNEEVEALLLRGAVVSKDGKYYRPASFDNESVSFGEGAVVNKVGKISTVKDFGAIGDGVTDDTESLQLALNEGGIILVEEGTYLISKTLQIKSNTKLIGFGQASKFIIADEVDFTPYTWRPDYNGFKGDATLPDYHPYLCIDNAEDVLVDSIFIEGNKNVFFNQIQVGLACESSKNINIKNVYISHINYHPTECPTPRPSGQWRTGWGFATMRSDNVSVDGGLFEYCGYECFRFGDFTTNSSLKNATIQYGWRTLFQILNGCENIELSNCTLTQDDFDYNDTHACITIHTYEDRPSDNIRIKNNTINGKLFCGHGSEAIVSCVNTCNKKITFEDNIINSDSLASVNLYADMCVIKNNTINIPNHNALYAGNSNGNTVIENNKIMAGLIAILISNGSAVIKNNYITNTDSSKAAITPVANEDVRLLIENNILEVTGNGIKCSNKDMKIIGNKINSGTTSILIDTALTESLFLINNNDIVSNGICIYNASNAYPRVICFANQFTAQSNHCIYTTGTLKIGSNIYNNAFNCSTSHTGFFVGSAGTCINCHIKDNHFVTGSYGIRILGENNINNIITGNYSKDCKNKNVLPEGNIIENNFDKE